MKEHRLEVADVFREHGEEFLPRCENCGATVWARCSLQVLATDGERGSAIAVCQEAEMANLHKSLRQNVKEKAPDELDCFKGHRLRLIAVFGVMPSESDMTVQESGIERRCPICHVGVLRVVEWLSADQIPGFLLQQVAPPPNWIDSS